MKEFRFDGPERFEVVIVNLNAFCMGKPDNLSNERCDVSIDGTAGSKKFFVGDLSFSPFKSLAVTTDVNRAIHTSYGNHIFLPKGFFYTDLNVRPSDNSPP